MYSHDNLSILRCRCNSCFLQLKAHESSARRCEKERRLW